MARSALKQTELVKQLHEIVEKGNVADLRTFIGAKEPSVIKDLCSEELKPYGSVLHHAAGAANREITAMILDTGIDVNITQVNSTVTQKQTPLHIAALAGNNGVVDVLLTHYADVNARESEGLTPLHCACSGNDVRTVELLLKAGASVSEMDTRGQYPLQRSILRSSNAITKMLLDKGADVNVRDECGQTVLHHATEWDNAELVNIFLQSGISANIRDSEGRSPLHLAEDKDILKILIQHGGDVTLRDKNGRPVIEKQLDMDKEEFQRINALLEQRLKPPETIDPNEGRMMDIQNKINKLVLPSGDGEQNARAGIMSELLAKTKKTDDNV